MSIQLIGSTQSGSTQLNQSQDTCQLTVFTAYGNATEPKNYAMFNGERRDPLSGNSHLGNGYRAYNPVLMRFHCPDSLSPFGQGGVNSYVYCGSDPVNLVDPSGHMGLMADLVEVFVGAAATLNQTDTVAESGSLAVADARLATTDAANAEIDVARPSAMNEHHHSAGSTQKSAIPDRISGNKATSAGPHREPQFSGQSHSQAEGLARRDELDRIIASHHTPGSIYIPAVSCVNGMLRSANIGISEEAFESISDNIRQVSRGTRTETAASLRESWVFSRDTFRNLRKGNIGDAGVTAFGAVINAVGSTHYLAKYDYERMQPFQRIMYDAMSPM